MEPILPLLISDASIYAQTPDSESQQFNTVEIIDYNFIY